MIVRRTALLAVLLIAGMTRLSAASRVEADPHELYEQARERLAKGQLEEAGAALSKLHALIAEHSDWDPKAPSQTSSFLRFGRG